MWNLDCINGACADKDRLYQYQKFCERLVLSKGTCNPKPPLEFKFLKSREKKKQMEKGKYQHIY